MRRWEFRRPILGRLVWGWLGLAIIGVLGAGWLFSAQTSKATMSKIALDLDSETTSLATPASKVPSLRLSPPETARNVTNTPNVSTRPLLTSATIASTGASSGPGSSQPSPPKKVDIRYGDNSGTLSAPSPTDTQSAGGNFKVVSVAEEIAKNTADHGPVKTPQSDDLPTDIQDNVVITIDGEPVSEKSPDVLNSASVTQTATWDRASINAPTSQLRQSSKYGSLPRIATDGRKAATYYARPHKIRQPEQMGLILTGLGLNDELTRRAINDLPGHVTLSFVPYGNTVDNYMRMAREKGHEVMLEIPMEGYGRNPEKVLGPAGLLTTRSIDENEQRLDWILSRGEGYFAATNYLGSKFSTNPKAILPMIARLDSLGIQYIDDTGADLPGQDLRANLIILADYTDAQSIASGLQSMLESARDGRPVLGKMAVSDASLTALEAFLTAFPQNEIDLAPASGLL